MCIVNLSFNVLNAKICYLDTIDSVYRLLSSKGTIFSSYFIIVSVITDQARPSAALVTHLPLHHHHNHHHYHCHQTQTQTQTLHMEWSHDKFHASSDKHCCLVQLRLTHSKFCTGKYHHDEILFYGVPNGTKSRKYGSTRLFMGFDNSIYGSPKFGLWNSII